ncbi:Chitin synthase, class 2 [Cladochytrium tenue]|nr:Chitin synthase, class 2 [Cladochytrium tenue]
MSSRDIERGAPDGAYYGRDQYAQQPQPRRERSESRPADPRGPSGPRSDPRQGGTSRSDSRSDGYPQQQQQQQREPRSSSRSDARSDAAPAAGGYPRSAGQPGDPSRRPTRQDSSYSAGESRPSASSQRSAEYRPARNNSEATMGGSSGGYGAPGYPAPPPQVGSPMMPAYQPNQRYPPAPGFPGAPVPGPYPMAPPGMMPPPPMGMMPPPPPGSPMTFGPGGSPISPKGGEDLQRRKTVRNIELSSEGNLVVDVPVPDKILELGRYKSGEEFTQMRYTAATCDPNDFPSGGYTLRPQEYGRKTELFVVVTMYNEDDLLFCKTIVALMKNIAYLCQRNRSSTWGEHGWEKVVVCIVSDGRTKIHPRVLNVLGIMGVYQDGIMKNKVNDSDVTAHIFEYTAQMVVDSEMNVHGPGQGMVPVQFIFCLKEKNAKKINSHRWFFNAFGPLLRPNVCILIDVGTKPTASSVYHLWKAFDRNPQVGGACGEIYAEVGSGCVKLFNPLVAAQNFEYKMSNILDKPLESAFGFIAVLPGAFSAYRYAAIQGAPLQQYFKGETMHGGDNIFQANMYLAEDRILCFELVTKREQSWILRYVKAAKAETDVPDTVPEFISQRRRWLNGSFFAGLHSLIHWHYLFRSRHSIFRKFFFCLEFIYNLVSLAFNWFGLANFYLTFYFLAKDPVTTINGSTFNALPGGDTLRVILQNLYLMCIVLIFICSLGNRPQGSKITYTLCMILFSLIMILLLYIGVIDIVSIIQSAETQKDTTILVLFKSYPAFRDMLLSVAATYGLYLVSSILYLEPWHMLTCMLQYLLLLPSYVNILMVYACKL